MHANCAFCYHLILNLESPDHEPVIEELDDCILEMNVEPVDYLDADVVDRLAYSCDESMKSLNAGSGSWIV